MSFLPLSSIYYKSGFLRDLNLQKQNLSPSWTKEVYANLTKEIAVVDSDVVVVVNVNG